MAGSDGEADRFEHPRASHVARRVTAGIVMLLVVGWLLYSLTEDIRKGSSPTAALESLNAWWLLAIGLGSVAVMVITTGTTAAPLPRLSFRAAFLSQHASQAVGNLVPGPSAMAVRYSMLRTYGVSGDEFARATITVSMVTVVVTSAMPLLGMIALALIGANDPDASSLLPVAIGATIFAAVLSTVTVLMLRSEPVTAWIARRVNATRAWLRRLFRRPARPDPGVAGALAGRERLLQGLRESGKRVVGFVLLLYWANGLLVVLCLWAVGIPYSHLGLIAGLAVYTVGRLSTLVQVTPGGVGVVELAYTAAYTAFLGQQWQGKIFAGIVIYRFGTYALPILVGMVSGGIWALTARRSYRAQQLRQAAGLDSEAETEKTDG